MVSYLRILGPDGARFGWIVRLMTAAILAGLVLLAVAGQTSAADEIKLIPVCCDDRAGTTANASRLPARLDSASLKAASASAPANQDEQDDQADAFVDKVLAQGRAVLDRYGAERVLLAVVVGTIAQVLCLLVIRFVGSLLGLVARVLTWGVGVTVALSLLGGNVGLPASTDDLVRWSGRLFDFVGVFA